MTVGLKKTFDISKKVANDYISLIETNNLFEVSLGRVVNKYGEIDAEASKYYTKAIDFQNEMNEKLGTNKQELMHYQAMYYSMFKSQGINKDASYLMSESLTKAGYDIASLYNLEPQKAVEKLRSGIAGQVEPLRAIGIDISESALTKVLNDVGIDRTVQQLSYAEKEVARYIAIIDQASQAQGDFARTFEQPANQLRVFINQLRELSQVAGSFIVNAFGNIFAYVNAIIMAIKEILKAIASLFGWNLSTSGGFVEVSDTVKDINTGLGGASKKAKELKNQLMGFDEINNITLPTNSKSGGSGGSTTGVDKKLLDSLKEWDNKMSSISGKAQEIRDKILDWLGFTKDFNGNLVWSWNHMNDIAKIIAIIAGIIAGITVLGVIVKIIGKFKTLFTILKTGKGATTTFGIGLQALKKVFDIFTTTIGLGIERFVQLKGTGISGFKALGKTATELFNLMLPIEQILLVVGLLIVRFIDLYKKSENFRDGIKVIFITIKDVFGYIIDLFNNIKNTIYTGVIKAVEYLGEKLSGLSKYIPQPIKDLFTDLKNDIERLDLDLGDLAITLGGIFLLFANPALGIAVLAFEGLSIIIRGIGEQCGETIIGLEELSKKNEELANSIEISNEAFEKQKQSIKESAESKMAEVEEIEILKGQLSSLVDENGKVISGYEGRVDFILGELNKALGTEYKAEGGIIKNYQQMQEEIDKLVQSKKKEIELEAYGELYKDAIKKKVEDTKNQVQAVENLNNALKAQEKAENEGWFAKMKANKAVEESRKVLDEANKALDDSTNSVVEFGQEYENIASGVVTATGTISTEISEATTKTIDEMKRLAEVSQAEFVTKLNEMDGAVRSSILAQATTIKTLTPEVQAEWNKLAKGSRDEFITAINQVPEDAQGAILKSITTAEGLTENTKEAWKNLSMKSKTEFEKNISEIEPMTRGQILASITATEGLTENTKQAWANLSEEDNKAYNAGITSLDKDTANKIQSAIDEIKNKENTASQEGNTLGSMIKSFFDNGLGDTANSARNFVQGFLGVISGNPFGIFETIKGFGELIVAQFNKGLGNASPSKKTKKSARFFAQGFNLQLFSEIPETLKQVQSFAENISDSFNDNLSINSQLDDFNKGIRINTKDYEVDTNSFINYGKVSGSIDSLVNLEVKSNLIEGLTNTLAKAINDKNVNVEITAKTEKGTIVETSVDGIKEYVKRTGSLPFPVPI